MAGSHRMKAIALVVAAGAVLATACQSGVWMGNATATSVSVMGDSLIYQAEGNYQSTDPPQRLLADELVAAGYRAHVSGWIGETIQAGHDDLWPIVENEPGLDIVVIALGTNDVNRSIPLEDSRASLDAWLTETDGVGCVALIGLNESAYAWSLDIYGPAFNQMLAEEADLHPNAIFVPWVPDLDIHGHDGDVHFKTAAAAAQYRTAIHGAVDSCAARLGGS